MDPVQEVKQRLGIAEVVSQYLVLKQAGRNLKAPCPFHHEKSASFMVSPDKNIYHCFGCNAGGDAFSFVMKMEGLEFREALEKLARQANVTLQERPADRKASQERARLLEAHEWAVKFFQASLLKNEKALDYVVKKRRLSRESISSFQIGYAPDTWEGLTKLLIKKGFSPAELKLAGLAGQKQGRNTVYDLFRGRIMLTICDGQGRPIGFTGRVLGDELPKYLNTPQTPLYDKSLAIYGLHLAKEAIRSQDEVILVEGNMDVVASHQAGVKNVIAVSGTALTLDQLKILSRLTKNVKLAFDQDAAGIKATERAIELGQKLGLVIKMIEIEGAKDPDELIQQDVELWRKSIAQAKYIMDYLFDRFERDYDLNSVIGKRQYSDRLSSNIRRLADAVEQDHYIRLLAQKLNVSEDGVRSKVLAQEEDVTESPRAAVQLQAKPQTGRDALEEGLLSAVIIDPEVRNVLVELKPEVFSKPERGRVLKGLQDNPAATVSELAEKLTSEADYINILALRGEEAYGSLAPADRSFEVHQLVRRLQIVSNQKTKTGLSSQIREAEKRGDTELIRTLLQEYQALISEEK